MKLKVATDCSGIGSPELALKQLGVEHDIIFACDIDKYARQTYLANFNPVQMFEDMRIRDNKNKKLYADLYMAGIPCQSFSLAGKRLGELDPRGLLFYNFYDYVKHQRPKYFIIENVKGLLSDNGGATFQTWLDLLSNSVNTMYNMFNNPDSLEYNVHWTVLNSKDFGVPQNRERVFIVGIRNDLPNTFRFPVGWHLDIRLKDILETDVDEKYYLSEKMLKYLFSRKDNFNGGNINFKTENDIASCINANSKSLDISDNIIVTNNSIKVKEATQAVVVAQKGRTGGGQHYEQHLEFRDDGITNAITSVQKDNMISLSNRIRKLTPLECFRLQGFPDDYIKPVSDSQLYKQAGNTITTTVIKAILKNLLT